MSNIPSIHPMTGQEKRIWENAYSSAFAIEYDKNYRRSSLEAIGRSAIYCANKAVTVFREYKAGNIT